ncbi:MAG TPA: DUF1015 domain-containing protein [Marinilabiliales bacterium]|nr:MAG: hypothetical protein A2W95_03795 [Bacteroidetes bacterium GWA2_40_14]OFX61234.1 MAG: hypothetical protein A2W84_00750 [Bacteroidetes bacterium GWC2_40_13]OFX75232.1 MAG: hypothetical protein A2W96_16675 [Bacteroidetes bacterium GWD2_40_43]OFX89829.1 MAG: hypothetical protein A2W97_12335 [Bacteroidetes bacterium GWE2_40_63]OFY21978.1 MAG: hypothetical protein A2W88_00510 [Bacteroidetes bacterium GWF2_40_13]OFZ30325.1 MAG: hypothetical protein A2437_09960 [Bacteroidetes bacterium RIFOXYC
MAIIKPFKGIRPPKETAATLACLPYDVMNSDEAAQMAKGKPESLLHITRAEIDCPAGTDIHSEEVYNKSVENYNLFKQKGWLKQDAEAKYYIYAQTMDGRTQYGIVGAAACDDYHNGVIKKHELTRPDKEEDRMILTRYLNSNIEPVFFSYRAVPEIDAIVDGIVKNKPAEYNFVAEDGFGHHLWVIDDAATNQKLEELFAAKVPFTYVADGHHRTAAAARIGLEKKTQNPNHTGNEEYNFFMAVHFPDNQLKIIDYNRVVKDLNGLSDGEFKKKLAGVFDITDMGTGIYHPAKLHEFSMYIGGHWYKLNAKAGTYNDNDPLQVLDVNILSNQVLDKILGIKDLRTTTRCEFVGGIRGLNELSRRVDSGEMMAAFALYPVSMKQLIDIADSGNIMPPKTTWFEPKLRSGLVIHEL